MIKLLAAAVAVCAVVAVVGAGARVTAAPGAPPGQPSAVFGGSGYEMGLAVANAGGSSYVTGRTESADFPVTAGAAQPRYGGGGADAFVAKINPNGTVAWATYLGGSGVDEGRGIAVDGAGNVVVAGFTESGDFPAARAGAGGRDAFVVRLSPDGALESSTLLGGSGTDSALALALDGGGNAYLTGETSSTDFPTTPGAFDRSPGGGVDAYAAEVDPAGRLVYSTLLGGPGFDDGLAIAVGPGGAAYVTGKASPGYPVTPGAYDTTQNGGYDMFVTKVDPGGTGLAYSTYVGGDSWDEGLGIAVDGDGNAYFTGNVQSRDYPRTPGAVGGPVRGTCGAAVSKLDPTGARLVYSGVLSGTAWDEGDGLAVDSSGAVYVAGHQASADFPTSDGGFDRTQNGDVDGFLAKVDPTGSQLAYSTFLGGAGWDGAMAMSIDSAGGAFLTGATTSTDFPGGRTRAGGGFDAFVTRIDTLAAAPPGSDPGTFTLDVTPDSGTVVRGASVDYTAVVKQAAGAPPASLSVEGLPDGTSAVLQARTADTTTITIETTASTPPGGYALTVVATSGGVQRTTTVRLNVHCCPRPA